MSVSTAQQQQYFFTVYVWPDGSWMHAEDFNEFEDMWKGEDFSIHKLPDSMEEEEIDQFALEQVTFTL